MHLPPVIAMPAAAIALFAFVTTIVAQDFAADPERPKETSDKFEIAVSINCQWCKMRGKLTAYDHLFVCSEIPSARFAS
jgi:hypothetical protein